MHKDHPQRDTLELVSDIHYPNLVFETQEVDFGAVLNDTERRVIVEATNPSTVPVRFQWVFVEPVDNGTSLLSVGWVRFAK